MNELKSPRSGKVSQIMVSDGQPVEFGEPLLVIE
jgi:acetyl-CoA carboxylase biotin carboxyl carrier protein